MLVVGTHPLPDRLLIEIGRFATTFAAIEQTIVLHATELYNFRNRYAEVEKLRLDFRQLRQKWVNICKESSGPAAHKTIERLNTRLASASKARGYILHGAWEVRDLPDVWNFNDGKEFRTTWWEQRTELAQYYVLPTDLSDIQDQCANLERLRLDLIEFLNSTRFEPDSDWKTKTGRT